MEFAPLLARYPAMVTWSPGFKRSRGPAGPNQVIGTGELALPHRGFTFVILHLKIHDGVRIHELKFSERAAHRDGFRGVVARLSMVSRKRYSDHEQPSRRNAKFCRIPHDVGIHLGGLYHRHLESVKCSLPGLASRARCPGPHLQAPKEPHPPIDPPDDSDSLKSRRADSRRMPQTTFTLNGKPATVFYEPGMDFLEVLREQCEIVSPRTAALRKALADAAPFWWMANPCSRVCGSRNT